MAVVEDFLRTSRTQIIDEKMNFAREIGRALIQRS
jgi:hypothetical protein